MTNTTEAPAPTSDPPSWEASRITHEYLMRDAVQDLMGDMVDAAAPTLGRIIAALDEGRPDTAVQKSHDAENVLAEDIGWYRPTMKHLAHVARAMALDLQLWCSVECCQIGWARWRSLYELGITESPESPKPIWVNGQAEPDAETHMAPHIPEQMKDEAS